MRKRILAGVLSLVMILALLPVNTLAAERAPTVEVHDVAGLQTALTSAAADTTIQLSDDIGSDTDRLSGAIVSTNVTLDLNGHTLYVTGNQSGSTVACAITQKAGKLTVTSSNGQGKINCNKGGFILQEYERFISSREEHEQVKKKYATQLELEMKGVDISCGNRTNAMLYLRPQSVTTLTGCTFTGGKSCEFTSYNGAVFFIQQSYPFKEKNTKLTVDSCEFDTNFTGVALSPGCDYDVDIQKSTFTGCHLGVGLMETEDSPSANLNLTVADTTFQENLHGLYFVNTNRRYPSSNKNKFDPTEGSRTVTITDCTFNKNDANKKQSCDWGNDEKLETNGGAIYCKTFYTKIADEAVLSYTDDLNIKGCTFSENAAKMDGGAIYLSPGSTTSVTISKSDKKDKTTFTKSKIGSDGNGGASLFISTALKTLTIEDTVVTESEDGTWTPAAIRTSNGEISIKNSKISNNNSAGLYTEITNNNPIPTNVTLEKVEISSNKDCGIFGGFSKLTVTDCTIANNQSSGDGVTYQEGGGGIGFLSGDVTINGTTKITGNSTDTYAGGIYAAKGTLDVADGVILCNNTADVGGADIWYKSRVTSVKLPNPANMNQVYLADGENQTITAWYKDWNPRYTDVNHTKTPYDYTEHIGTGDVPLVAAYTPVAKFDVTFDLNYDGAPEATVQKVEDGQTATEPSVPTREGYVFKGWYTEATGGDKYDFSQSVTADTTLYAHWAKTYTVSYHLDDGKGAEGADYTEKTVEENTEITLAAAPTKDGYTFTGWSDGTNTYQPGATLTVNGDITLTAQWRKNSSGGTTYYTLHYESNGGTQYKDERHRRNTVVNLDKVPVREGYQFTGWYGDKDLTEQVTSVKMTGDKTVYAGWHKSTVPDMLNGEDHFAYVIGYGDGTVHPGADISRAEVATIFFRLLKPEIRDGNLTDASPFADVSQGMWCNKAIATMAKLGIVKGRTAETFDPSAPITRAEFAAICARFDTGMTQGSSNFTDLAGHWAKEEIERAVSLGWIMGYADGTFRPDNPITRAEAMTMINRVLCRIPEDGDDLLPGMKTWPDNQPGDWYYLAVQEATNSHEFQHKGEIHEHWTKLTADPDWTRYQG